MTKISDPKKIRNLIFLFSLTYFVSYITRINYGAIISEMERATQLSRSLLSMAVTGSFITYGVGQIISGICGDAFSPKKLISLGLCVTILMNVLLPLCTNPYIMLAIWCINGFAQAFMWPPMLKLMIFLLTDESYRQETVKVSMGASVGTIAVYLLSPLLISLFGWKSVFFFSAAAGGVMLMFCNMFCPDIPKTPKMPHTKKNSADFKILFSPLMISVMLAIVLQGMLRDGVTTWMPTYISETYQLSNIIAILTGVILPIFSIISFQVTAWLYHRKLTNPLLCAGVIFGVGAVSALALVLLTGHNAVFSVIFSALLTACMHGVNLILISMLPAYFQKYGNVSTVSGVLNACTYIGSAISTYGIALLSEQFSWQLTLVVWLLIAACGAVLCLSCIKPWQKRMEE
ncbi:MAG: MFS transporter [Firmicutes bacterium]|nr:MFS transporter [Bacillota bacterium]